MARNLYEIAGDSAADREAREEHFKAVRLECVEFRRSTNKEQTWLDLWTYFRNLKDNDSYYKNKLVSTYLWSAIHSWISVIEPAFFRTFPIFDLRTPRLEDEGRNKLLEEILTQQVHYQSNLRRALGQILPECLLFGASFPWTNFRTQFKKFPMTVPKLDARGFPLLTENDEIETVRRFKEIRVYHAPHVTPVDLWDSFIHPDGVRGFSCRELTGYDLWQMSGEGGQFDRSRVSEMLLAAERRIQSDKHPLRKTRQNDWVPGDDSLQDRDELAKYAGTFAGDRLTSYVMGLVKDAWAQKFPILYYDDGNFLGVYALNKDGRLMELAWHVGSCPDGGSHRLAIRPHADLGEKTVFGASVAELGLEHLKIHSRFTQLAVDAAELTCHPQWLGSQQWDQLGEDLITGPGAINIVPSMQGEDPTNHLQPQILPAGFERALAYRENVELELDQLFAQHDFSRGRVSQGRRPAAEINLISQFGASRIQLIMDRIATDLGVPLGRKWLCMNAVHLSPQDVYEILGQKSMGFIHPTNEEIIRTMQVVFRGSVTASNQAMMAQRFTQMAPQYQAMLPYAHLPYVNEFMRKWLEANEMESVAAVLPVPNKEIGSRLEMELAMGAAANQPAGTGTPQRPRSPTDAQYLMQQEGAAGGPPPPPNTAPGG